MQSRQAGQPQAAQASGLGLKVATMGEPDFEHFLRRLSAARRLPCCRCRHRPVCKPQTRSNNRRVGVIVVWLPGDLILIVVVMRRLGAS
jgi:hypothetical protein